MSRTLEISDETYEKIKNQLKEDEDFEVNDYKDFIGKKLFIRTVTYHVTGEVTAIISFGTVKFFCLKKAAWIADSGRFMEAIKDGKLNEVEPVGQMWVNVNAITDMFPWEHTLPQTQI